MNDHSLRFHRFVLALVGFTVLLIWWGAATTTTNAGMVFADWPLSQGSLNPPRWLEVAPFRWEHGHRLIASAVGTLTAIMFAWSFVRNRRQALEFGAVVTGMGLLVGFLGRGAEIRRHGGEQYEFWFWGAAVIGLAATVWLVLALSVRKWSLVTKLCALAFMSVGLQAVLGGLRVTEISNTFAVLHGCLAQSLFCLLILIAMISSPRWQVYCREAVHRRALGPLRARSVALFLVVFVQLILGATIRHTHRLGIADDGILTTGGAFFPGWGDFDLAILFSHKAWALMVLLTSVSVSFFAKRCLRDHRRLRRHAYWISGVVVGQLTLGSMVIASGKGFWVTNFHVLTGLTILALSFALMVRSFAAAAGTRKEVSLEDTFAETAESDVLKAI
jgi:cytochrome c oxidase assembly protein subunit 15